jgi:glycosyltransferase involved in cell wall biosynthesis
MKVLHVLAEKGYSGGELQLEHVVRHLQQRGHDNALVLPPNARFAEVARDRIGIAEDRIHTVDLRRPLRPPVALRLRRALLEELPDVLHFGCGRSLLWGGLFALGWHPPGSSQRPLRVTTRRIDYPIPRSFWKAGRYKHLVDHTVANCRSVERRVLDAGVPPERVTVVYEGIDVEPWTHVPEQRASARRAFDLDAEDLLVICPATLRPRKGQAVLIEAFARIAASHPRARLLLAGDGPDRTALQRQAEALRLGDRIQVPGPIRPPEPMFAAADVLVMPSFHEGLSNACLEGSAAGLPLVVTTVGGLPEIVADGETGFTVPPGEVAPLAEALDRLLGDANLRRRCGEAGAERTCSLFTAQRSVEGIEALWTRLLDEHRSAGR